MALGTVSSKISRQILGVIDDPRSFADILKTALHGASINPKILDDMAKDALEAIQNNDIAKFLSDARIDASDEKLKLLDSPEFKQALDFGANLENFAQDFGDNFFNGKDIDLSAIASKYGIGDQIGLYKTAQDLIDDRAQKVDAKANELVQIIGGKKEDHIERATNDWVEKQKAQHEKMESRQSRAGARTLSMDDANIEKLIMEDIRDGKNPDFDAFANNNLNLNDSSINVARRLFQEANEQIIADAKIIAGPNGKHEDFMVLARHDIIAEDRIKNPDNYIQQEAFEGTPEVEFLTRSSNVSLLLADIDNPKTIEEITNNPSYLKGSKEKPLNAIEKSEKIQSFAGIVRNDLKITMETALKSGDEAKLQKLQNDIVILAKDYGNPQAADFYGRPEFLSSLKDSSQRIQFETELWDSIQHGNALDFSEMHAKYKDIDPNYIYKAQDFFDKANDEIGEAVANGKDISSARADWVGKSKPIDVLGDYTPPNTAEKDLPKFNPAKILNWNKIAMHLHPETMNFKERFFSSKNMLPKSVNVTRPVTEYIDKTMDSMGMREALQQLNKDVLEVAKGNSDFSASDIIDNFAKDNREMLARFRDKMQELEEHVDKKFKTNAERNNGDDRAMNGDDLTIGQKGELLLYIRDMKDKAADIARGIEGKNGNEILENLKLIRSGGLDLKDVIDSMTGLSRSVRIANNAEIRLTGFWPDQDHLDPSERVRASGQYITSLEQQLEKRAYDYTEHKGKPLTYGFLQAKQRGQEKSDNLENTEQKFIEKYTARKEDGSSVFDWENDRAGETFLAELKELFINGRGHGAVEVVELLSKMTQTEGKQGKTLVSSTNWVDAVNALKKGDTDPFWHSETFDLYNKRIKSTIERESAGASGHQDTSFWTRGRLDYFFAENRQGRTRAARADYQVSYATRHSNSNMWNLYGIPGLGTRKLSLPGGILATNISRYVIHKPMSYIFGYDTYKPGVKITTGIEAKDFFSDADNDHIIKNWRKVDEDGKLVEGQVKPLLRAAARLPTGFLFKDTTIGKGYWGRVKEGSAFAPTTWFRAAGLEVSTFGKYAMGASALIGAGSEIYNGEYEGLSTDEFTLELAKNTAWGLGTGVITTMVDYDDGVMLGTIPRLGVRGAIGGLNIITDGIGGVGEGVAHAMTKGDAFEFFDINREEDDGFNLSAWTLNKWPSLALDSHWNDDYKKNLKTQKSAGGATISGGGSILSQGGAENMPEAKEMAVANLQAARVSASDTDAAFNDLILQLDTFANDRMAALDSNISASIALGEVEKVTGYETLKTQLDATIDGFRKQIKADKLAVNESAIEKLTEIGKLHDIVIATDDNAHVSGSNSLLDKQKSLIKQLDSISDKSINLRMAEINAMTSSFDAAINSATPFAASAPPPAPHDLVADEQAASQDTANKLAANQEAAEKLAADKLAREELARIKETPLGKAKIAAITALAAVKKEAGSANNSVTKAKDMLKSMDDQASAIEKIKKEIQGSGDSDRHERINNLSALLVSIKDRREIAAEKLVSLKSAAEHAKGVELSAVVLSEEIKNIPAIDDAANTAQATEKLADLQVQIDMAKAPANDAKSLLVEISQLGKQNIADLTANQDMVASFKEMTPEEQVQAGILAMSGGSKNGIPYMIAGDRGNGVGSFIGGAWDTAVGSTKKFGNFWDDLERNTKSQSEQNWLLGLKSAFFLFGGMMAINTANMLPGVNISKGWKLSILLVVAGVIMHKSGAWGDKMEAAREGKKPFAQGNSFDSGAATAASDKNTTSNIPTGERPFGNFKVSSSSNPNPQDISGDNINMQDATAQRHAGMSLPQNLGSPAMSSDIEKALLASVTGKSTTDAGIPDTATMLRHNELDAINIPYSQMSANDAQHSIRVTA